MLAYNNQRMAMPSHDRLSTMTVVRYRIGAMFLLIFAIPFQELQPFGTAYLNIPFISFFIYLFFSIATLRFSFRVREIWPFVAPVLLIVILFWVMSAVYNKPNLVMSFSESRRLIMFLLMYIFIINEIKERPELADKALAVFVYSLMIMTISYLLGFGTRTGNTGRVTFSGINANKLGLWYVIGLFIIVKLILEGRVQKYQKYLMFIFGILFITIIARTASRSGFGALIMGPSFYLYFLNIPIKRKVPIAIVGGIIIAVMGIYIGTSGLLAERLAEVSSGGIGEREHIWETAMILVRENLIFGSGASGYEAWMSQNFSGYEAPHNVYLLILSYTGLVGLSIFLVFLFRWGVAAFSINKKQRSPFYVSLFLVLLVYLFTAGGVFDSFHFWMVAAITIGVYCSYTVKSNRAPMHDPRNILRKPA